MDIRFHQVKLPSRNLDMKSKGSPALGRYSCRMNLFDLVEDCTELPTAPQLLPRLQSMLSDLNTDPDDIVRLVNIDSGLTGRIMRLANSVYYGSFQPISSLNEAVGRIGFRQMYRSVSMAAASSALGSELPTYTMAAGELLQASLANAFMMGELQTKSTDADANFTIGLFHSVGKVVVNAYFSRRNLEVYNGEQLEEEILEWERRILGFDFAEAGAAILERWYFPPSIVGAVRHQLNPLEADEAIAPFAARIYLSKWIVTNCWTSCLVRRWMPDFEGDPQILALAGVEQDMLLEITERAQQRFADACEALETIA